MTLHAYFRAGHREHPATANTPDELTEVIDEFMGEGFDRSIAVLSVVEPGDGGSRALHVAVDPERGVGALLYIDSTDAWYSKGTTSEREDLFYCYYGEDHDFPRDAELTLATVRSAAAEFLRTERRPTCVTWTSSDATPTHHRDRMQLDHHGSKLSIAYEHRASGDELVVFLHGLACAKETFELAFSEPFLRPDLSLLALDFPGHGLSDPLPHDADDYLTAYAAITRQVVANLAPRAVHLVGHSMGGAVGLLAAQDWPELASFISVDGNLVAEDCGLVSRATANQELGEFRQRDYWDFLADLAYSGSASLSAWANWYRRCDPATLHACARSLVAWSDSTRLAAAFKALPRRAYVYGAATGLPAHLTAALAGAEVRSVADAGHFSMIDNPDGLYKAIGALLAGQP